MTVFFNRAKAGMFDVFLGFASQPPEFMKLLVWACGVPSSYPHPGSLMQEGGKDVADEGFGSGRECIVKDAERCTPENSHWLGPFPHSPPDGAWWCLVVPGRGKWFALDKGRLEFECRSIDLSQSLLGKEYHLNLPINSHHPLLPGSHPHHLK